MIEWINTTPKYKEIRSFYNETNDCTVRAFAEVFNTSYDRARRHLELNCGRKPRKGINSRQTLPQSLKNTRYRVGAYSKANRITISQFVKKHPIGRYYCCVRGHAIAIIDGVVYDYCHKPRRQITWAMRVYPNTDV